MALHSARFAGNRRLQQAAKNTPPLKRGERGYAVRLVQQALIDSGLPMPISTRRHGSPDGIYGQETYRKMREYQRAQSLGVDGVTGKNTLHRMDQLLTGITSKLPPLPTGVPVSVSGVLKPTKQQNSMSCWAAGYTTMLSWKRQGSISVAEAIQGLGPKWVRMYTSNSGLPVKDHVAFALAARLKAAPLMNPSLEDWAARLRTNGPLWVVYGWRQTNFDGSISTGRHTVIIHGMYGNGSYTGTRVKFIDPGDGQYHEKSYQQFVTDHETGLTLGIGKQPGFSQILHY